MKKFEGHSNNIKRAIICRISAKLSSNRSNSELFHCVSGDDSSSSNVFISCGPIESKYIDEHTPLFQIHDPELQLNIGDIVLLEPSEKGIFLFESLSKSNALFLTERCNCRCVMCPQPPQKDREDYVSIALKTLSLLEDNTDVLGITGGEPTLVWDDLIKVIHASQTKLPDTVLQLLTNGRILKNYDKATELVSAGGKKLMVCIPLYADCSVLHDSIVNSKGAFWETIEGIYNLERLGVQVELRNVIMKVNFERLPQWSEFVYLNFPFADHVALMGIEPYGLASVNADQVWIDPLDYTEQLQKSIEIFQRRNMNVSIFNHQLCVLPQPLWRFSSKSISEWKNKYYPVCDLCMIKAKCGGFFASSDNNRSYGIKPITLGNYPIH